MRSLLVATMMLASIEARAEDLTGTYRWTGDSDGAKPNPDTQLVLRVTGGAFEIVATQGTDTTTFAGTIKVTGDKVTIHFDQDPGGGQRADNAPFAKKDKQLTLPFGIGSAKATSTWLRFDDNKYIKLERGACPSGMPVCNAATLAAQSAPGDCWFNVAYAGTQVLDKQVVCVETCADRSLPVQTNACKALGACWAGFVGKKTFRNFADLDKPTRAAIAAQQTEVIKLAKASAPAEAKVKSEADLNALANAKDPHRTDVETKLLDLLMTNMAPFDWSCTNAAERPKVTWNFAGVYGKPPQVAVSSAGALAPMAFIDAYTFKLYYAAFLYRPKPDVFTVLPAEETVAAMLHELVHFGQPDRGLGDTASIQASQLQLSELEAYGKMMVHPFYRWLLDPLQFKDYVTTGMTAQIAAFKKDVPTSKAALRKLAQWAWTQPWMLIKMKTDPQSDGGVWATLCNVDKSPCRGPT